MLASSRPAGCPELYPSFSAMATANGVPQDCQAEEAARATRAGRVVTSPSGVTALAPGVLTEMRDRADREAGPFVDPRILHQIRAVAPHPEWAAAILGHPFLGVRAAPWRDLYLLYLATQAEPNPPAPPSVAARPAARSPRPRMWSSGAAS